MSLSRREFAVRSAFTGAGFTVLGSAGVPAGAPGGLAEAAAEPAGTPDSGTDGPGYGPLVPDPEGILALPAGFTYRVLTRSGETVLETGEPTPSNHNGTAAFRAPSGVTLLVNNHELKGPRTDWEHPVPLTEGFVYDPAAAGGCTVVELPGGGADRAGLGEVTEWVGIAGTSTNCAGGATPWGTWLTCEENVDKAGERGMTKDHGYLFEVDPHDRRANRDPRPVKALGRSEHAPRSSTESAATSS